MLTQLLTEGYGSGEDFNCAEKIVYGANKAYSLGINEEDLKLSAAFGGGMGVESTCGVITGAMMVLGRMFTDTVQHQSDVLRPLTNEFLDKYRARMNSLDCAPLKEAHRTEEAGCSPVIIAGAEILDAIISREQSK